MTFQAVPNTVKAQFFFSSTAEDGLVSVGLHFEREAFTPTEMEALAQHLQDNFATDLRTALPNSLTLEEIGITDLNAADGYKVNHAVNALGLLAGAAVTSGLALVISFNGERRGKWNMGRNYVPAINETDLGVDELGGTVPAAVLAAYQTLIDSAPPGWIWVIVSRYLNGVKRPNGVTAQVTNVRIRSAIVGFQRRRVNRP